MCWNKRGGAGLGAGGLMVWRVRPLPQQPPGMLAAAWLAGGLRPRASQAWAGAGSAAAALLPLPRPWAPSLAAAEAAAAHLLRLAVSGRQGQSRCSAESPRVLVLGHVCPAAASCLIGQNNRRGLQQPATNRCAATTREILSGSHMCGTT
jgi:hypothetical protein